MLDSLARVPSLRDSLEHYLWVVGDGLADERCGEEQPAKLHQTFSSTTSHTYLFSFTSTPISLKSLFKYL